jgi:hypothetical protein
MKKNNKLYAKMAMATFSKKYKLSEKLETSMCV